jgi:two-component system, NtrC family, sensor kinase
MPGDASAFDPPLPERAVLAISVAFTLLVGVGDYVTGIEVAFTLLYLLPIAFCTWYAGWRSGAAISVLAAACAIVSAHPATRLSTVLWNELGSLTIFLVLAYTLGRLREYVAREHAQKRAIVEQLRHADRLNVIGTLAAGVAHELGTPLNVITGSAELLATSRSSEDLQKMTTLIQEQAQKIGAIIRHLLEFGHRAATTVCMLDLNAVANGSTQLLVPVARKRSCRIHLATAGEPIRVQGNAAELEQVVSNMVLNAIQAMPEGGNVDVRLSVTSRVDGRGDPRAFGAIEIEDNGVGIAAGDLGRIFDPFFTTKGVGEGTGLGLSVSYGIVRDHDGAIEVQSSPGKGTKFTVLLPLAAA